MTYSSRRAHVGVASDAHSSDRSHEGAMGIPIAVMGLTNVPSRSAFPVTSIRYTSADILTYKAEFRSETTDQLIIRPLKQQESVSIWQVN